MALFETDYLVINHDEQENIIEVVWKPSSLKMNKRAFQENMMASFQKTISLRSVSVLADTTQFQFSIDPITQDWVTKNIMSKYAEYGVKRIGFMESTDIFAQISMEQIIEDTDNVEARFFDNKEEAIRWLSHN